jgi:hypothetical protein
MSPTTKRMIKHRMNQKTGSSVRNCAKELNKSKCFKIKRKKLNFNTAQRFVKSTDWGKLTKEPFLSQKNIEDRIKFGEIVRKSGHLGEKRQGQEL